MFAEKHLNGGDELRIDGGGHVGQLKVQLYGDVIENGQGQVRILVHVQEADGLVVAKLVFEIDGEQMQTLDADLVRGWVMFGVLDVNVAEVEDQAIVR